MLVAKVKFLLYILTYAVFTLQIIIQITVGLVSASNSKLTSNWELSRSVYIELATIEVSNFLRHLK